LSAGEAQLLVFARVFLRDQRLVVLDEATSRLDRASEQLIERVIERLTVGRRCTLIVIAHRLSTVMRADRIVIIEDGRVVEQGERAALQADASSRFAALLRAGLESSNWSMFRQRPWVVIGPVILRTLVFGVAPLLTALVIRAVFDALSLRQPDIEAALRLAAVLVGLALGRLRDDVPEAVYPPRQIAWPLSHSVWGIGALFVLLQINTGLAFAIAPLLLVYTSVAVLARERVSRYSRGRKAAAAKPISFIAQIFGSAQARVIDELGRLNEARRVATLRDVAFSRGLEALISNADNIAIGAVLLLSCGRHHRRSKRCLSGGATKQPDIDRPRLQSTVM
jgi:hypothetical protein